MMTSDKKPIKKVEIEMGGYFGNKEHIIIDFVNKIVTDSEWDGSIDLGESTIILDNYDIRELQSAFCCCSKWQIDYINTDVLDGYYWIVTVDGKKYQGTNACPDDWTEFYDNIADILNLRNFDDFVGLDYEVSDYEGIEYQMAEFANEMKEEHPQTYFRGQSLFFKGHVRELNPKNRVERKALVIGSNGDEYQVSYCHWKDDTINHFKCSCPSNQVVCKHIVAAILADRVDTMYKRYKVAEVEGSIVGPYQIDDEDLLRLIKALCTEDYCIITPKVLADIKICQTLIAEAEATVDEEVRGLIHSLSWDYMRMNKLIPQETRENLYKSLEALFSQVENPEG